MVCILTFDVRGDSIDMMEHVDTLTFYFKCADTDIDRNAVYNASSLDRLAAIVDSMALNAQGDTIVVTLCGWASPEGPKALNTTLSQRRAATVEKLLRQTIPSSTPVRYDIRANGENWQGLAIQIAASDLPNRNAILEIIDKPNAKERLRKLDNNRTWSMLVRRYFPTLRCVDMTASYLYPVVTVTTDTIAADVTSPALPAPTDTTTYACDSIATYPISKCNWLIAAKTNMLYDALAVPNIGIEIPLPKHYSIGADWEYAWWKCDHSHRYWRIYGGDLFARRWFGSDKPLTGHHIGIYGGIVTYDFELGGRGYLGDKWSYGGGIDYGYSLRIANRLNLDMTIGIGYLGGKYKEYIPDAGCYVWQCTRQRNYFGPTKAEISLVWFIGCGYSNTRKGGEK
jgi:Protein of unknown function (DUF3575)